MKVFPITREKYANYLPQKARRFTGMLSGWGEQFTPFSHEKKDADNCVIGNGVPKSGTHLLTSLLNYLGKWEDVGVWLGIDTWKFLSHPERTHRGSMRFAIRKLRNGQWAAGHLPWSQALAKSFSHETPVRRLKHIMIYRDPRDIAVSGMNFSTYKHNYPSRFMEPVDQEQRFMEENFRSDDERLTYYIARANLTRSKLWEPWLRDPDCFAVKFEDIYPEILDLRNDRMGDVLRKLLDYLEIDPNVIDPVDFHDKVNGKSRTASLEERKIGQYKRMFKDHHYAMLDNPEFKNTLAALGYQW